MPLPYPRCAIVIASELLQSMGVSTGSQVMMEFNPKRPVIDQRRRIAQEPRKLLLALALLLIALVVLLIKDRQFWFGTEQATIDTEMPATSPASHPAPAQAARSQVHPAPKKQVAAAKIHAEPKPAENSAVVNRTVLPPLDVEVVAGQTHKRVHLKNNPAKIQLATPPSEAGQTEDLRAATNAAERAPVATPPIQPEEPGKQYPALAQHMNVQGSVVLQAIISAEGEIQDLKVLSGPAILASAARQAVMEWRFKPMFQNGQAVESKARITVNFMIRVADGSEKMTLAESRMADNLIITR